MPSIISTEEYENDQLIPLIDLSFLANGLDDKDEELMLDKVKNACQEWGCFLVFNHGIDEKLIGEMDSATRETFKVPRENKEKIQGEFGYIPSMSALPFLEILPVNGAPDPNAIQKFALQLWPQGNPRICKIIEEYTSRIEELTNEIIKLILKSYGVSKYYESQFCGLVRMNYCEVPEKGKGGLGAHTDHNFITVIYQDNNGGLEVKSKAGKWVQVLKAPHNSFVVLTGDSIKAWSNGQIHSGIHRVMVDRKSQRVSVPYFSFFPDDTVIEAPPEFVDEEHPRLYKPFHYGKYKTYCKAIKRARCENGDLFEGETDEAFLENFLAT